MPPAPSSGKGDVAWVEVLLQAEGPLCFPPTSIWPEGWSCKVLGSRPAIQRLAIRGQRDPTMTKDLVPGKALSCVGY